MHYPRVCYRFDAMTLKAKIPGLARTPQAARMHTASQGANPEAQPRESRLCRNNSEAVLIETKPTRSRRPKHGKSPQGKHESPPGPAVEEKKTASR
ncbi:hypothetical protein NDU88_003711 [Pleurodeles waltl]|uniref:Uncharacterized protein n=1 Tax=Pleurodeles waltl TaxID=8319 RepID=A0AAV7VE27_PLEWA|nr:hypothetical protein NDU88_003711 [Pleurodeles waltl]